MKRRVAIIAATLAAAVAVPLTAATVATASTTAAAPYCGITWGSVTKQSGGMPTGELRNVRAGRQACFDRLVFDFAGHPTGYWVSYVDQVRPPGEPGDSVPLRGGARLQITISLAYGEGANATYQPANPAEVVDVTGWPTFRQVAWADTYEGEITVGLGVRARLPFRVFVLAGPGSGSRIVVDVAHRW
jgi:hypothetical protein